MGNTLSMARSKKICSKRNINRRRTKDMLLASGKSRVSAIPPSGRNKRKKAVTSHKSTKGRTSEDFEKEGKISTTVKNLDGSTTRSKRHRRHDKDRQPYRGTQREDITPRRSASELGIDWIGDICPDGQPHYLIAKHTFDGGSIFKCMQCHKHIWLPTLLSDATELEFLIKHYGAQTGYRKFLDKHQAAKVMVAKLQDLWFMRKITTDEEAFKRLVISVMKEKDYDRKEATK